MQEVTDKLVEEFSEDIDENEMAYNFILNKKVCKSCML